MCHTTWLKELFDLSPDIAVSAKRRRDLSAWPKWCDSASQTLLASFAQSTSVGMEPPNQLLSSKPGAMVGRRNVHRLKLIKRPMYGAASFGLLRACVLPTTSNPVNQIA
jgi:hypothetical protein